VTDIAGRKGGGQLPANRQSVSRRASSASAIYDRITATCPAISPATAPPDVHNGIALIICSELITD